MSCGCCDCEDPWHGVGEVAASPLPTAPPNEAREIGPIHLDRNRLGHIFIDQDDADAPFGTRVILTPAQALQVVEFIARAGAASPTAPDEPLGR